MDYLKITNLRMRTKIGVHKWEQAILQTLSLDIEIATDTSNCQDNIDNTIDYDKLCTTLTQHIANNSFSLIETVAEEVVTIIKEKFQTAKTEQITVTVNKPNAIANAGNVGVKITR